MNETNTTTPCTYVEECEFDAAALTELYNFQRAHNPALKGLSGKDIAEMCDMSENTMRELLKGKNKNPRLGTIKRFIRVIGGVSLDKLTGFAPPRDFDKEAETYDATLVEALQVRLDEKRETITELKAQVVDLNNIIHQEGASCKEALGKVQAMEQRLADKREQIARNERIIDDQIATIKRLRQKNVILAVLCVAFAVILAMLYIV